MSVHEVLLGVGSPAGDRLFETRPVIARNGLIASVINRPHRKNEVRRPTFRVAAFLGSGDSVVAADERGNIYSFRLVVACLCLKSRSIFGPLSSRSLLLPF